MKDKINFAKFCEPSPELGEQSDPIIASIMIV